MSLKQLKRSLYGTESVPKVDKIVGPGNAFVAEAKRQVFGKVSIDMIAGPSEIMVVADKYSNPKHVAADLLSQAEHDKMASAVLVTDSEILANAVSNELERQIPLLSRPGRLRLCLRHRRPGGPERPQVPEKTQPPQPLPGGAPQL